MCGGSDGDDDGVAGGGGIQWRDILVSCSEAVFGGVTAWGGRKAWAVPSRRQAEAWQNLPAVCA